MNNPDPRLQNIVFIAIPAELKHHFAEFALDPDVLLPVETAAGPDSYDVEELSWEMILSGMLRVLAVEPDHEDAAYYRRFVLAMRPNIAHELGQAGVEQIQNGGYELAQEIFLALIGVDPEAVEGKVNLALLYERQAEQYEQRNDDMQRDAYRIMAQQIYDNLLRDAEDLPPLVYFNAGNFFFRLGSFERAQAQFEMYLQLGDDDEDRHAHAARVLREIGSRNLTNALFQDAYRLVREGREEEGIVMAQRFLEHNPESWNGWFVLGWAERRRGHFGAAQEAFQRAVRCGADNADTFNELALCAMERGELDVARSNLEQALNREPDNTKIISNLGVLELKRGNKAEAIRFFRTVLAIDPADPIAQQMVESIT